MGKFPSSDGADADMHSRDAYSVKGRALSGWSKADDQMMVGRFVGFKLRTSQGVAVSDGESAAARTIKRMLEEDRWSSRRSWTWVLPWDQPGHPRAEAVRPAGERDSEDKAAEAQLPPPLAGSGHWRRVDLKHGDFIKLRLSESRPGCRAMKVRVQGAGSGPRHEWARVEFQGGKSRRSGEGIGTSVESTNSADEVGASGQRCHGVHVRPLPPPRRREHGVLVRGKLGSIALEGGL